MIFVGPAIGALFLLLFIVPITFVTAFIPAYATQMFALRYSIRGAWFFALCGALTGLILSPIPLILIYGDPFRMPTFLLQALDYAVFLSPSGAVGGLIFWWLTGRFVNEPPQEPTAAPAPNP
jgi:hypothetical protein